MKNQYESQSVEYGTWTRMISRCHDMEDPGYIDYGKRGIKVCDRWRYSYHNFLSDMGRRPEDKSSLDRINNDKGYSPENCRWADWFEQANNRRDTIHVTIDGISKSVSQWCALYNLKISSVFDRINKRNWTPEEAITIPMLRHRQVKIDGKIKTVSQWSKQFGVFPQSVNRCIRKGMTPEQALYHVKEKTWKTKKNRV